MLSRCIHIDSCVKTPLDLGDRYASLPSYSNLPRHFTMGMAYMVDVDVVLLSSLNVRLNKVHTDPTFYTRVIQLSSCAI